MAVVNTKSTAIANADATPRVPTPSWLENKMLRSSIATVEVAAGDDDGSTFRMARIKTGERVHQLLIANDAITGGTDYVVGLYQTAVNGGAVVDADIFSTTVDLSSLSSALDVTFVDIANAEKRIWELLGQTEDPFTEYDVVLTANTVGTAAGTIVLRGVFSR